METEVEFCGCTVESSKSCGTCEQCENCCDCSNCEGCGDTHLASAGQSCRKCDRCCECCDCITCDGCSRKETEEYSSTCDCCGYLISCCCECNKCDRCGGRTDSICYDCDRCEGCCNCRSSRSSIEINSYALTFHHSTAKEFKRNTLKRHLSTELEIYETDGEAATTLQNVINYWRDSVVKDGSIDGDDGFEINTQPTNGDKFLDHIAELALGFKNASATANDSCGMHVHVNARDLGYYDLRKVLLLYERVEPALFGLCGMSRIDSTYSAPCADQYSYMPRTPKSFKRELLGRLYFDNKRMPHHPSIVEGIIYRDSKHDKHGSNPRTNKTTRYRALNLHSFFHRSGTHGGKSQGGTIEFRHHEGSVDYTEITNWALTCGWVVEQAHRMTEAQITALPHSAQSLYTILPSHLGEWAKTKIDARNKYLTEYFNSSEGYTMYSLLNRRYQSRKQELCAALLATSAISLTINE